MAAPIYFPFPLLGLRGESQIQPEAQSRATPFIDGFKRRNFPVFLPGSLKVRFFYYFFLPCIWSLGPFHL